MACAARGERHAAEADGAEAVAVKAGRGRLVVGAALAAAQHGDLVGHEVGLDPVDVVHESELGRPRQRDLVGQALVLERLVEAGEVASLQDHVAGQEDLHDLGDAIAGLPPLLVGERAGQLAGDDVQGVAAQLERLLQVVLRRRHRVGHVEVLGAIDQRGRFAAQSVDRVRSVDGLVLTAVGAQQTEQLAALQVGLCDQLVG